MITPVFASTLIPYDSHRLFAPASHLTGEHVPTAEGASATYAIQNGFDVRERRFGESFDVSSHAAVIKMMMLRFGRNPRDMLEGLRPSVGGFDVVMKDGFALHLSKQELKRVEQVSGLSGTDDAMVASANFMLAVFAKRKQLFSRHYRGGRAFEDALSTTLRGETTYNVLKGMGMVGFMLNVEPQDMHRKGVVAVVSSSNFSGALALEGMMRGHGGRAWPVRQHGYRLAAPVPADPRGKVASLSTVPVGVKPANILSGFYQGSEGNCVTVSAIKAAMMKYGQNPSGIFKHVIQTPQGYTVTMRDGCTVRLTYAELGKALAGSRFWGEDKGLLRDAVFLYAVSAKRAQLENHEFRAGRSFEAAMNTLNDGEMPGDALRRLGLYAFIRASTVKELAEGGAGTLANYQHSVAVVNGAFDDYGAKRNLRTSHWMAPSGVALKLV